MRGRGPGQAPSVQYARTVAAEYGIPFAMRKCRTVKTGRCYHLISRLAHRAFFLDDDEKTRAVDLMRRIGEFVFASASMSKKDPGLELPRARMVSLEKGLIERADPDHPQSPQQMYRRVK